MVEHANRDVVNPTLLILNQIFERFVVICAGPEHEILIFMLGA